MKLRNKKTGEIESVDYISVARSAFDLYSNEGNKKIASGISPIPLCYESLKEVNEEWEDYKPAEPLIKDEEKLDTVKSFFALLGITKEIYYQSINNCFYHTDDDGITYGIDFDNDKGIEKIYTHRAYTIAELCGEEEE